MSTILQKFSGPKCRSFSYWICFVAIFIPPFAGAYPGIGCCKVLFSDQAICRKSHRRTTDKTLWADLLYCHNFATVGLANLARNNYKSTCCHASNNLILCKLHLSSSPVSVLRRVVRRLPLDCITIIDPCKSTRKEIREIFLRNFRPVFLIALDALRSVNRDRQSRPQMPRDSVQGPWALLGSYGP